MMKRLVILMVSVLIFLGTFSTVAAKDTIVLKKPPEVLAKWYKPLNKRQVWLHTMFRLRREMLAMTDYAQKGQQAGLEKWSEKFAEDYQSIATMVPDWQKYLHTDKLESLRKVVKNKEYSSISPILKKIGKSCRKCHDDYQTVASLLYRSPDFSQQTIITSNTQQVLEYDEVMGQLSDSVNRINIAIKDSYFTEAYEALAPLQQLLQELSNNCSNCHKKDEVPVQRIFGASQLHLKELAEKLKLYEQKQAGRKLGEFAVHVCARCHAIHRLTADLKSELE